MTKIKTLSMFYQHISKLHQIDGLFRFFMQNVWTLSTIHCSVSMGGSVAWKLSKRRCVWHTIVLPCTGVGYGVETEDRWWNNFTWVKLVFIQPPTLSFRGSVGSAVRNRRVNILQWRSSHRTPRHASMYPTKVKLNFLVSKQCARDNWRGHQVGKWL